MRVQLHFFSFVLSIICSPTKPLSSCSPLPCPVCVQLLFLSFMLSIICSQIKQSSCRSPSSSLHAGFGLLYFCVHTHKHTHTHTQAHTHTLSLSLSISLIQISFSTSLHADPRLFHVVNIYGRRSEGRREESSR